MRALRSPSSVTTSQSAVLIIRRVPVNYDVFEEHDDGMKRLPPSQFNSPSVKKEEEGVTARDLI